MGYMLQEVVEARWWDLIYLEVNKREKLHLFFLPIDFHWLLVEPSSHSEERCESLTSSDACLNTEDALRNCNYGQRLYKLPWPDWIWPLDTPFFLQSNASSFSLPCSLKLTLSLLLPPLSSKVADAMRRMHERQNIGKVLLLPEPKKEEEKEPEKEAEKEEEKPAEASASPGEEEKAKPEEAKEDQGWEGE